MLQNSPMRGIEFAGWLLSFDFCLASFNRFLKGTAMSDLIVQYGGTILVHFKMIASSFYGLITFLAASWYLNAIHGFYGTAQTNILDYEIGGEPGFANGGNVRKESFIANLVANMTVHELGEMLFQDSHISPMYHSSFVFNFSY